MQTSKYYYLIQIQYCGFRFSGWQKQTNSKTIQEMVDRTIRFIFPDDQFKTLGAGRTDAKVSANDFLLELFISHAVDPAHFLSDLNKNLPPDIRALRVEEVDEKFDIIGSPTQKEYVYLFTTGVKPHPFSAPFMVHFDSDLNIELMKEGARIFEGLHNFQDYCYKPSPNTILEREIVCCEIVKNDLYTASFFPDESWLLRVKGKGFLRHQLRMIMATLVHLGCGEMTLDDLSLSLSGQKRIDVGFMAPSSGLILNEISLK